METIDSIQEQRQHFYDKINPANLTPLWEVLHDVITKEPKTPCLPYLWKWSQVRQWLLEAGGIISAQEAERRVLARENPGLRGPTRITHSPYAGTQLILPGEVRPAHRHTPSALP